MKFFETITILGAKNPTKRDKWRIELSADELEITGKCDYNAARIIHILQDCLSESQKELGRLKETEDE